jgi:outer membrane protein OmpA-like peptidoglycan-associated protein
MPFDAAVAAATDDLMAQTRVMPAVLDRIEGQIPRGVVVIDPMLDGVTGQQTVVSELMEQKVAGRIQSRYAKFEIIPLSFSNLAKAQYVLTGSITRESPGSGKAGKSTFLINLALIDLKAASIMAQARARSRDDGVDINPTPFYRDSPVVTRDMIVDGYIRTSTTTTGAAADAAYVQQLPLSALMTDAVRSYNEGRFKDALALYKQAAARSGGEQLRVLSGIYLCYWQLGQTSEAEQAFAKIVSLGLASNSLNIKFLFTPDTTEFPADPQVSGAYPIWLRQVARQAAASHVCMTLVGHTSRTGTEAYNDRLSQQRSAAIKKRLETESAQLNGQLRSTGVGFRENIVGIGTDDFRDALDRRVEFRVTGCQAA